MSAVFSDITANNFQNLFHILFSKCYLGSERAIFSFSPLSVVFHYHLFIHFIGIFTYAELEELREQLDEVPGAQSLLRQLSIRSSGTTVSNPGR